MSLKVGDVVTVKVRNPLWKFKHVYASYVDVPEFHVYTGKLMPPGRGDAYDSVRITSDDPSYPVRLIDVSRIEDLGAPPRAEEVKRETWTVKGSKGGKYIITRDGTDYACTCAGYEFRQRCRHIDELRARAA